MAGVRMGTSKFRKIDKFAAKNLPKRVYIKNAVAFSKKLASPKIYETSRLIDRDYIYKDERGIYRLLDPLFGYILA